MCNYHNSELKLDKMVRKLKEVCVYGVISQRKIEWYDNERENSDS